LIACVAALGAALFLLPIIIATWDSPRDDAYSLVLTAADGFVPPAAGDEDGPSLSPELNLTLYAENMRQVVGSCLLELPKLNISGILLQDLNIT